LQKKFPCTKEFLFEFSRDHPAVLRAYREHLKRLEKEGLSGVVADPDEALIVMALIDALHSVPAGSAKAADYHRVMVGVVELIFFPQLLAPKKEREIHAGRKRIDILMENGARDGIFQRLHSVRGIPCSFVPIECKNYSTEIANPDWIRSVVGYLRSEERSASSTAARLKKERSSLKGAGTPSEMIGA
jgi:hypothetical protein